MKSYPVSDDYYLHVYAVEPRHPRVADDLRSFGPLDWFLILNQLASGASLGDSTGDGPTEAETRVSPLVQAVVCLANYYRASATTPSLQQVHPSKRSVGAERAAPLRHSDPSICFDSSF